MATEWRWTDEISFVLAAFSIDLNFKHVLLIIFQLCRFVIVVFDIVGKISHGSLLIVSQCGCYHWTDKVVNWHRNSIRRFFTFLFSWTTRYQILKLIDCRFLAWYVFSEVKWKFNDSIEKQNNQLIFSMCYRFGFLFFSKTSTTDFLTVWKFSNPSTNISPFSCLPLSKTFPFLSSKKLSLPWNPFLSRRLHSKYLRVGVPTSSQDYLLKNHSQISCFHCFIWQQFSSSSLLLLTNTCDAN